MREIWKPYTGFEEYYLVSNKGNVFSLRSNKRLKLTTKKTGYIDIELCVNGRSYYKRVHRMVAEVFLKNPENKPIVNHLDGNKSNNNVKNLEWATHSDNCIHAIRNNLYIPMQYRFYYELVNDESSELVDSQKELCRKTGYSLSLIVSYVKNGLPLRRGRYKGFRIIKHYKKPSSTIETTKRLARE